MRPAEIRVALEGAVNVRANRRANAPSQNVLPAAQAQYGDVEDELEISEEAHNKHNQRNCCPDEMRDKAEQAREAARAAAEFWRNKLKAQEIARRIMKGDNVPQKDYDFLMEHDPDLFKKAVSLRRFDNDDPKDHDALSDGDESTAATDVIGTDMLDSISVPTTSTPTISGGGNIAY